MCPVCGRPTPNLDRSFPPNPMACDKCERERKVVDQAVIVGAPIAAADFGVSERTVRRWCAKHGVKLAEDIN